MKLNELRQEINRIDDALLKLFVQRMRIAAQIADYKKNNDLPIFVPTREDEILKNVAIKAGPEMAEYAKILYSTLFELSRNYQTEHNCNNI